MIFLKFFKTLWEKSSPRSPATDSNCAGPFRLRPTCNSSLVATVSRMIPRRLA